MFFRRKEAEPTDDSALLQVIVQAIPDSDADTHAIVTAIAGLLGCVSYADQEFSSAERDVAQHLLSSINGITTADSDKIVLALEENILHIATVESPRFCRTLVQLGERELRVNVLDMLLELAAADDDISHDEVVVLRQITKSLGLDQQDYNRLQTRHRGLLTSLRSGQE